MGGSGPFGESSGGPAPIAVENFHMLRDRQTADTVVDPGRQGQPGQPAQLGRQGPPRRAVPAVASAGQAPPGRR